jgi:UDP-N-acetylmuramyl pentapeptide phosphotransferase/UDP-N-acetylglucosamine-1-phosphate transferase
LEPKWCKDKPQATNVHKTNHGPILGGITILFPILCFVIQGCKDKPQATNVHKTNHGPILGGITILFPILCFVIEIQGLYQNDEIFWNSKL